MKSYLRNLEWINQKLPENARVVPGHGPLSNKRDLEQYIQMITSSISIVKGAIKKGKTLEQIQKQGLPEKWASFSHGYRTTDQGLQSVYQSVQEK
ncbi:MAG: hypothetical protein NTV34_04330 [Proteobacteria bacterium]|nr:hypothetical protein [Pseudomonadota bacterium]